MGEVYKARDTRLGRTVAVKVLPDRLSSDAELRQRFEREARTISQLSHPHICALYDVGHQDGTAHSFASLLASKGVSIQVIAMALGHSSASMAERYARPDEEALRTIREALNTVTPSTVQALVAAAV